MAGKGQLILSGSIVLKLLKDAVQRLAKVDAPGCVNAAGKLGQK